MTAPNERLARLLALVPYLIARPGVRIDEAAADFGVSDKQLRKDLELLWMCGLPGYGPGDLIDLSFEGDTVTVAFDAGMRRPLRLTAAEATALVVALKALSDLPGVLDADAVHRSIAKIEAAAGEASPAGVVVGLSAHNAQPSPVVAAAVQQAIRGTRAIRMTYYTASRDELGERTVDPMRVLLLDGRSYLEGWCRNAEDVRLFRLDRIDEITVLDEPAAAPKGLPRTDVSNGFFPPAPDQRTAVLVLEPDARWIAEYYPVEEVTELADGRARIRMRYSSTSWMVRLLLGQGGEVTVEEPVDLVEHVVNRARAAMVRASHLPAT